MINCITRFMGGQASHMIYRVEINLRVESSESVESQIQNNRTEGRNHHYRKTTCFFSASHHIISRIGPKRSVVYHLSLVAYDLT
jgi:hypothetical protein